MTKNSKSRARKQPSNRIRVRGKDGKLHESKVTYADAAKRLRQVRTLPFKSRTQFDPWEKAYLSRQFAKHRNAIRAVELGKADKVKTTEYRAKRFEDQYHRVGNTLIIPRPQQTRGKDKTSRATVKKRGGRLFMDIKRGQREQEYYPVSREGDGATRRELERKLADLRRRYPNGTFRLAIGGNPAYQAKTADQFLQYLAELEDMGSFDEDSDAYFTGIFVDA